MMHRLWTRLCSVLALAPVVMLVGCATPNSVPPGGEARLLAEVKAGTVQMDCGLACAPAYLFNQSELQKLYRAQDWPALAVATAQTSYRRDIAYFYLGLAAEGMQAWAAADRYYRMAGALATGSDVQGKCSNIKNLCAGFSFPRDIVARLRVVSAALGRAPVSAQQLHSADTQPARMGEADFIPEAPQALLRHYAALRLAGSARPDPDVLEQALEVMEPELAQSTRGNEIARARALESLTQRLGSQASEQRLALGMWVQVLNYDRASQSFELRYPLHTRSKPPELHNSIYSGESPRTGPYRDYSGRGSTCVWEDRRSANYLRADEPDAYFVLLTLCQQRPAAPWRAGMLQPGQAELPPTTQLVLPQGSLWPRVSVAEPRAEAVLRKIGRQRQLWAELVFDVRAVGAVRSGPFPVRETVQQRRPGMTASIMPRALFIWETPPEANRPGRLLAVAGDVVGTAPVPEGRLARMLVADRSYAGLPEPVITEPAGAGAAAPRSVAPAPVKAVPTPAPRAAAAKPAARADDDEDWVEPPPARR